MSTKTPSPINLADYSFTPERGFLPEQDPLADIHDFPLLNEIGLQLSKRLAAKQVRSWVDQHYLSLPSSYKQWQSAEFEAAGRIFSFVGHSYVWEDPEHPATSIPSQLAISWQQVLSHLERPPVLSYASYALHNWARIDSNKPIDLDNIVLLQNFLGGIDEEWFILIHVAIEAKAGELIHYLVAAINAAFKSDLNQLTLQLQQASVVLEQICDILGRMPERCDPYIYYQRVRPYIHGWKDNPSLPQGVIYQGVREYQQQPQFFRGETGAQSSIIPCLDAILGVEHSDDPLVRYLIEMRLYMPATHRALLTALQKLSADDGQASNNDGQALLIATVKQNRQQYPAMWQAFSDCVNLVARFRRIHLEYARKYIHKQHQTSLSNPTTVGTGGTPFIQYLQKHLDETMQVIKS